VTAIAYGNGQFVGVSASGTVVTSADGATWIHHATHVSFASIGHGNGLFIASDADHNTLATSTDGVNWIEQTSSARVDASAMAYGNGRFVAHGEECVSWGWAVKPARVLP
jgi:hypothetical protein